MKIARILITVLALAAISVTGAFADDLANIEKKGTFSFAMSGQYPPFNFVDDTNTLTGFDVQVGKEIAKRIGVDAKPVTTAWDGIIAGLLAEKYDAIIGSMAITEARKKSIDFSDPYYRSGAQLFVGKNSDAESTDDMAGKTVGVTLGTTYEEWVRANVSNVKIKTYKGVPDMVLEVANGRIDGFVTDRIVGALAIKDKNAPMKLAGELLYEEHMGIAIRKGNPKLKAAINDALTGMKEDGTYHDISIKWLGIDVR